MELEPQSKSDTARANGAKSRGPTTPEGKARSSRNAVKHGLNSNVTVLPGESKEEFEDLLEAHRIQYQPSGEIEMDLVRSMAVARWRLRRIAAMESDLFANGLVRYKPEMKRECGGVDNPRSLAYVLRALADNSSVLPLLIRYEASLARGHDRAFKHLTALQKLRNEPKPLAPGRRPLAPVASPPSLPNPDRKGGDPTTLKKVETNAKGAPH